MSQQGISTATPEQVAEWAKLRLRGERDPETREALRLYSDPEYARRRATEAEKRKEAK